MNRISILILICLVFDFILFASNPIKKEVIIEGKVVNYSDKSAKTVTAIDCNPWNDISLRNAVEIDSTGHFKTHINIPFGHNFTIYYDRTFFCQYAEPGDSIFMVIDANNLKSGAKYSGTRGEFNNEFGKAYAKLFNSFFAEEPPSGKIGKEEYLKIFNNLQAKNLVNINNYADSVGMSHDAKWLLTQSSLFSLANYALDHKDETPEKVLSFFNESIFGLDEESNLKEMMFPTHLNAYLWRLADVVKPDSAIQMVNAITSRHPKSLNRDIMLAIYLKNISEDEELPVLSRDIFHDENIYELVFDKNDDILLLPEIPDATDLIYEWKNGIPVECKYRNLTDLLNKEFAGKIVYLDLWATWCGPCVAANKSLAEVANYFNGKDIVFVSVAMKSDFEKWKKHANGLSVNCRNFFITDDDYTELIMSKYGMNGFPAFRIMGRDSRIIDSDPPHPNSPEIYDSLSEILNNIAE